MTAGDEFPYNKIDDYYESMCNLIDDLRARVVVAEEDADDLYAWFVQARPPGTYSPGSSIALLFDRHAAAVASRPKATQ